MWETGKPVQADAKGKNAKVRLISASYSDFYCDLLGFIFQCCRIYLYENTYSEYNFQLLLI